MTKTGRCKPMFRLLLGTLLGVFAALETAAVTGAEDTVPQAGSSCSVDLADAMTLLPDATTYVVCGQSGDGYTWAPAQTPFPPNNRWLSYGPPITLHGQGMRNPNLSSGQWTATPRDPQTVCRATQTTVVEAGELAAPEVTEGQQGASLSVEMQPKLFYAELAGDCLWDKD